MNEQHNDKRIMEGLFKVSVFYPYSPGKRFDLGYYAQHHWPMMLALLGDAVRANGIETGIGPSANASSPFIVMGHTYFDDRAAFEKAFAPHAGTILSDVPHFTDIEPVMQLSQVVHWQEAILESH
jgi:uncharacterized protein (TIGR02118 family)